MVYVWLLKEAPNCAAKHMKTEHRKLVDITVDYSYLKRLWLFFQLQYFQTCIWKSLWCFCVVQWSHPVASWVNHICVFPMDIWGSLLQEFLLIYYDSLESNSIAGKQYMSTFTSRFVPKRPWLIKKKVWTIHEMNSKEVMNPPWRQS